MSEAAQFPRSRMSFLTVVLYGMVNGRHVMVLHNLRALIVMIPTCGIHIPVSLATI